MTDLKTQRLQMVISPTQIEQIDAWRAKQAGVPSRSEAIRRLVEKALQDEACKADNVAG